MEGGGREVKEEGMEDGVEEGEREEGEWGGGGRDGWMTEGSSSLTRAGTLLNTISGCSPVNTLRP